MPISSRDDYLLRMIQDLARALARVLLRKRERDFGGALRETRDAIGELLGARAELAQRLDSETAAHLVGEPEVVAGWARLVAEEAGIWRELDRPDDAAALDRRALELALEAHLRFARPRAEVVAFIERLRPAVDEASLAPRHRDALAELRPSGALPLSEHPVFPPLEFD